MTTTARRYTPAQVSALSDRELSEAVAREVFGARRVSDSQHVLKDGEFLSRAYGAFVKVSGSTILLDAETEAGLNSVLKHMRQQWEKIPEHIWWDINDGERSSGWSVRVMHVESSYGPGELAEVHHASLGRAVMEAALLASQVLRP